MTEPRGAVHDLGYRRYAGVRRPQHTRWQVISRQAMSFAWRRWWRYKLWAAGAAMTAAVLVTVMIVVRGETFSALEGAQQIVIRLADQLVFMAVPLLLANAFFASLAIAAGVIAGDARSGAFTFYFARPVRPVDYVLGKLIGGWILQAWLILAPLLVVAAVRVGLSTSTDELVDNLDLIPKMLLLGGLASLAYAAMPLGMSAMFRSPRLAIGMWAVWSLMGAGVLTAITAAIFQTPVAIALEPNLGLMFMGYQLAGLPADDVMPPVWASIGALLAYAALGVTLAYRRVAREAHAGIGGG